jgi:serine/threonine protein kinase/tetratricopeptide (TPR) repeat protein
MASASAAAAPATRSEVEMRSSGQQFPTLPETPLRHNLDKARVRAALFRKVEPIRVGRFILLEPLGVGGMGEIYTAYDERLDRRVALKLVRQGSKLPINADDLLLREAQALAKLSHPNVVQIYEAGTDNGRLFIAMELIRGQTLTSWLADAAAMPRRQRQRELLRRFIAAGRGLEAVHAAGVAHRDFKPDNVIVGDDGRVRVVDFGLARALVEDPSPGARTTSATLEGRVVSADELGRGQTLPMAVSKWPFQNTLPPAFSTDAGTLIDRLGSSSEPDPSAQPAPHPAVSSPPRLTASTRLTEPGMFMGTPRFMSPEQMQGVLADHRSDQFSFCVALYYALYGVFPFRGDTRETLLASMRAGVRGLEHKGGVPARIRKVLRRGLSFESPDRFASTSDLLAALEPRIRRRGWWIVGAAVVALAAAAVGLWSTLASNPCSEAGNAIYASWTLERQAVVHAAFVGSDLPYAEAGWRGVKQRIDGYLSRWRGEAIAACRVTYVDHVESEQLFDRRMLCLERDRGDVEALISEFSTGAVDAVQRAVEAAESLPDVHTCSHTEGMMFGLAPPPSVIAREVAAVRGKLATASAREQLGHAEEALAIAREAGVMAERLSYRPVRAEALVQVARALDGRGSAAARSEAQGLYLQALNIAEAERHDALATVIWGRLVLLAARMDGGTQQAHEWWLRYEAAVRRIGNSAHEQARLHHMLGEIDYRDGKYAEAADEENRAITAISGAPDQQLQLSRYYDALAKALELQDRLDEALRLHELALKTASEALGPAHPNLIKLQVNYAKALQRRGQLALGRAVLEAALASIPPNRRDSHIDAGRLHGFLSEGSYVEGKLEDAALQARMSLEIYRRAGAPEHLIAEAYTDLGNVELRRKNFAGALAQYESALALRRKYLERDHYQIGATEGSIADALVGLSRFADAMPHVVEAERIFERGSARDRAIQAWILTVHGEVLVGQLRPADAIPVLEQALPLFAGAVDPSNPPRAMWALARALRSLGKDPARVRQLAEQAAAQFETLGPAEAGDRDAVRSFLRGLPRGPAPASPAGPGPTK